MSKQRAWCLVVIAALMGVAVGWAVPGVWSPKPAAARVERTRELPDTPMARDLRLLRKTNLVMPDLIEASSPEAIHAAERIFAKVSFVGMSKDDVLWLLGDPRTISGYGEKMGPGRDDPIEYRFDTGWWGRGYIVEFEDGKVSKVRSFGIY